MHTVDDAIRQEIQVGLGAIVRWSRVAFFDQVISIAGLAIDRSTITILDLLRANGVLRYSQLSASLALDRSTVSRQVAAAIAAGFVKQSNDPTDGRARMLELTPAGEYALDRASLGWKHVVEALVEDWSERDQRKLATMLSRLSDRMYDSYYRGSD